jgi:murein DD-endopeptidase MepM/ murein hydrolase activator NlpD
MRWALCAATAALFFPAVAAAQRNAGWELSLQWPARGTITSPFGQDGSRWHPGLDIGILRSLDVRAAAAGIVTRVASGPGFAGYGNVVVVEHRDGYSTLYAHLANALVHIGQQVWPGDLLGNAGCTGICTGTHLHFELRYRDKAIDPTFLMVG